MDYNNESSNKNNKTMGEETSSDKAWLEAKLANLYSIQLALSEKMEEQYNLWGSPIFAHDMKTWITILGEEYGKLCKAALAHDGDGDQAKFKAQLLDIAGVSMSALHGLIMEEVDAKSRYE